ncbi:hypothetical protein NI17_019005 [Thermobifida halotolerans]|uniref:Uncharacterized protein n=1 Tax=Thermobifida halotolerans TaxID=483545 RepID=A0A399FUF1_9ACTN|nr:hypothetical protein [Thermobifida halotolerans]UOE18842.1 hypothetical protein NI17_019005 [Thermobifida halotolerans]
MRDVLPGPVRWARILVFVLAGLVFALSAVELLRVGLTSEAVGYLVFAGTSGGSQLILGLLMHQRGWPVLAAVIVVQSLTASATLLFPGQDGVLTQLVLPVAVAVLVLTRPAREHYLRS